MSFWLLTSNPSYLSHAMNEIKSIDQQLQFSRPIELGVVPFESSLQESELHERIADLRPIFIRHLHPVQKTLDPTRFGADGAINTDSLTAAIAESAKELLVEAGIPESGTIGVQIRREESLAGFPSTAEIRDAILVDITVKDPEYAVSIFLAKQMIYIGISKTADNLSSWPGGAVRLKLPPSSPSRSRLKLEEAFQAFGLEALDLVDALDLGAAPGGWTSFLLDQGFRVTAVDTGAMDKRWADHRNLTFIRQNAHQAKLPADSFDLLTSDMSWNPYITCERVASLAETLRQDGRAVVTIKLLNQKVTKTIKETLQILERSYQVLGCRQLFHNRDEVTAYLRKKK